MKIDAEIEYNKPDNIEKMNDEWKEKTRQENEKIAQLLSTQNKGK